MPAYYNEFDPKAAAWLRELIKRGLIADGEVDERSILDVAPDDLRGFTQCHFFAGIGGWSYALRLAGWSDDTPVWTGSPPCQPFSSAGQNVGQDDERHLAPHFVELVRACRPRVLFGEQVASAAVFGKATSGSRKAAGGQPAWAWFDDLSDRLEAARYAVGASDIPAAGIGAPHIRQRTFFGAVRLADAADERLSVGRREQGGSPGSVEQSERLCADERLADASADGSQGRIRGGQDQEREAVNRQAGCDSATDGHWRDGGVGNSKSWGHRRSLQKNGDDTRNERESGTASILGGLADADSYGRKARHQIRPDGKEHDAQHGRSESDQRASAYHGGWATADWLFCRDGKWRAVEPGSFPLADGLPARVGRLRGYGNAIVPQAAAIFIGAFSEAADGAI